MIVEITDPMAKMMGLEVQEVREDGLTVKGELKEEFCNTYGFAHGGYVYALGHITAALSAKVCLNRSCVVVDASSQYLSSLKASPAYGVSTLRRAGREIIVYTVVIRDAYGRDCASHTITLKEVDFAPRAMGERPITIVHDQSGEPDPVTNMIYPKISPFFGTSCHVHCLGRGESGMIYGADIYPDTCNEFGTAHGGMIFTCCDACTGSSSVVLLNKRPVTASSHISYLRGVRNGPVKAEAKLIRDGKQLMHYNVDVTDRDGNLAAVAQFSLMGVNYKAVENLDPMYKNKAFKD